MTSQTSYLLHTKLCREPNLKEMYKEIIRVNLDILQYKTVQTNENNKYKKKNTQCILIMSEVKSVNFYLPYVEVMSLEKDVSVVTSNRGDKGKSQKLRTTNPNIMFIIWFGM